MKTVLSIILLSLIFAFNGNGYVFAQTGFGSSQKFNDGWLFALNPTEDDLYRPFFDDSNLERVNLPHDWSIRQPMDSTLAAATGFLPGGTGWYRKHFEITDSLPLHYIYFEGIYNRSDVYLNGHRIGGRPNGYISTLYDLSPYLKKGDNVLAVKVDHSRYADSRWYTGSGIYRDTWLISAGATHLTQWGVGFTTKSIDDKGATVEVSVEVDNPVGSYLNVRLIDSKGKVVAESDGKAEKKNRYSFHVGNPQLWSVSDPNLYKLYIVVSDSMGNHVDETTSYVGIRTIHFSSDKGFFLNGENMKIKGVCLHHDAGTLGAAVPREVWRRRLCNLKSIGVNAIRMSHNPQAPMVYGICDEIGLLVMDEASDEWEFPKRKWIKGWNVGKPGYDGSYDFFEEWIDRDVADMVRRDRLHPSIILWSIGNEVDYPNDPYSHPILDGAEINQPMFGGYKPDAPDAGRIGKIAKRLAAVVRSIDTSRPVTGALAGVVMSNETEYPEAVDAVGYNYTEDRYDMDHASYPDRIIYGSENSSTYDAWKAVRNREFISGQFIWTGTDYLGESNGWPARGFYTGLLDFGSFTKPRGHFRAALWKDEPTIYIGTYPVPKDDPILHPAEAAMHPDNNGPWLSIDAVDTWNYSPGDTIRVVCYTNTPFARLNLNGIEAGEKKPFDDDTGIIYWDIPFAPGVLSAEGIDDKGKTVVDYSIPTVGDPVKLEARVEETDMSEGVKHIVVEILDSNGNRVKSATNEIVCILDGDGSLLGLENSDNNDTGDFTDNRQHAYQGRLLAYIKKGEGPLTITFKADGLSSMTINLE